MLHFFALEKRKRKIHNGTSLYVNCVICSKPNNISYYINSAPGHEYHPNHFALWNPLFYWGTSTPLGNDSNKWRGVIWRNGLPNLNPSGGLFLDFCANHSLSITSIIFKHKHLNKCLLHQDTLGWRSVIKFRVVSPALQPYVLLSTGG